MEVLLKVEVFDVFYAERIKLEFSRLKKLEFLIIKKQEPAL